MLRELGYEVLCAANAGEALLIAEQHERPIHLLLSNVVLPRMSGRRLADRLAALRPEMKLLMMSGYAEEDERATEGPGRVVPVLQKPLTPRRLARCVRTVLDGASTIRPAPPA